MLLTTEKDLLSSEGSDRPSAPGMRKAGHECPRCESRSIARSRIRGVLGRVVNRMLGLRPYRCLDCWHRFMDSTRHAQKTDPASATRSAL